MELGVWKEVNESLEICNRLIAMTRQDAELFSKAAKGDVLTMLLDRSKKTQRILETIRDEISTLLQTDIRM